MRNAAHDRMQVAFSLPQATHLPRFACDVTAIHRTRWSYQDAFWSHILTAVDSGATISSDDFFHALSSASTTFILASLFIASAGDVPVVPEEGWLARRVVTHVITTFGVVESRATGVFTSCMHCGSTGHEDQDYVHGSHWKLQKRHSLWGRSVLEQVRVSLLYLAGNFSCFFF